MLCEKCGKNNATTHIRTIVNGVVTEKNLCGYCAENEGYNDFAGNSLTHILASMLTDTSAVGARLKQKCCECCGASFSDIAEGGKVGCSECYKTFYDELLPYLKRVHGATKHSGRVPNRAPLSVRTETDTVASLRMELSRLVSEENFEQAAVIRDRIKRLEEGEN